MSPDENFGRRIIGSFLLGTFVALINFVLDVSFIRLRVLPATTVLNDLIIGATTGLLAYFWMARQFARACARVISGKAQRRSGTE